MIPVRWRWPAAAALVLASAVYAFLCLRTAIRPWNDFAFVYAAGRTWLAGHTPYDFDRWNTEWAAIRPPETEVSQPMPFMYPPYWAPIAMAFASVSWPVAIRLWDLSNVACFLVTCALCLDMTPGGLRGAARRPEAWVFVALAGLNPSVHYSAWQSQMGIVATMGVVGAYWAFRAKKRTWLAVFAFIAMLKPQLGLLTMLFILLSGGIAGVLWATAAALVVGTVAVLPHFQSLPAHLARNYALHLQLRFNAPKEFASVPSVAASLVSGHQFMIIGPVLAVIAIVAVAFTRRRSEALRSEPLLELALLAAITGAFMPVHAYDLAIYTPIAILAYEFRSSWAKLLPIVLLVLCAGRSHIFARYAGFDVGAGYLTGLMAVTVVVLTNERRGRPRMSASPETA